MFKKYENKGLTGLANLGNTCFVNTTVQCISHIYELNDFLEKGTFENRINKKPDSLLLLEWNKLRKMMWSENCTIQPGAFISTIQKVSKIQNKSLFTGFAQNDLPEFLIFLIDCFHTAISREVEMTIRGKIKTKTDVVAKKCFEMMKNMYQTDYSEFLDLFFGILVSQISLDTDEIISTKPEPFNLLTLPIPTKKNPTLRECFELYVKEEVLEGDNKYFYEKTQKKEKVNKKIMFWKFPDILIIQLKRFTNAGRKNQKYVDFPLEKLVLTDLIIGYEQDSFIYDLFGICNHLGTPRGGHYTSFVKNVNKWYHFNDATVNEIEQHKIKTNKAYCLFYRKKKKL